MIWSSEKSKRFSDWSSLSAWSTVSSSIIKSSWSTNNCVPSLWNWSIFKRIRTLTISPLPPPTHRWEIRWAKSTIVCSVGVYRMFYTNWKLWSTNEPSVNMNRIFFPIPIQFFLLPPSSPSTVTHQLMMMSTFFSNPLLQQYKKPSSAQTRSERCFFSLFLIGLSLMDQRNTWTIYRLRLHHGTASFKHLVDIEPVLSLNGRCVLSYEHGTLLSVDSMLEQIFKANVHTKQVEVWYINDLLTSGINGIRRSAMDHYLYLSNTDRAMMFRLAIDPFDYRLKGQLETIVKNIDRMGAIYATTHVQNSLMRLTPVKDGGDMREELRMSVDGLAGATSCVFGRTYQDRTEFDSIITVIRRREGDEHRQSTTSDHSHPQRCSAGRLINSPISPVEMKSIFHSRLIVSGGDVPLSMNTYIRIHSSSTCTLFITIFLVAFVAVVVLCLKLFCMERERKQTPSHWYSIVDRWCL